MTKMKTTIAVWQC